jgi:hypothetical protein
MYKTQIQNSKFKAPREESCTLNKGKAGIGIANLKLRTDKKPILGLYFSLLSWNLRPGI